MCHDERVLSSFIDTIHSLATALQLRKLPMLCTKSSAAAALEDAAISTARRSEAQEAEKGGRRPARQVSARLHQQMQTGSCSRSPTRLTDTVALQKSFSLSCRRLRSRQFLHRRLTATQERLSTQIAELRTSFSVVPIRFAAQPTLITLWKLRRSILAAIF